MNETMIKICGITSPEDAKLSLSLGADYLGLIFADSPRRVTPDTAVAIREALPEAMLVGVFADAPLDDVVATCRLVRPNLVQLHGSESPEYVGALFDRVCLPIIKSVTTDQPEIVARAGEYRRSSFFLFDLDKRSKKTDAPRESLWTAASDLRRQGYRIFLAGRLNPSNVRKAIDHVAPFAIDVASGVEVTPGVKDSETLGRFIREVRG